MKTAEIHFEPDGVILLEGTSTSQSAEFNPVLHNTVSKLAKPEVQTTIGLRNGGNTLAVAVRVGPPGWIGARNAEALAEAPTVKARKKPGPKPGKKAKI